MIKGKNKILFGIIILAIVVLTFFVSNNPSVVTETEKELAVGAITNTQEVYEELIENEQKKEVETEVVLPDLPENKSTENAEDVTDSEDDVMICSLYVRCDTLFNNIEKLDKSKISIIPGDGIIYKNSRVNISDGDSVFDILLREMKENKIHLEFTKTPVYNSAYIEGIGNIYEFDCGELSGWIYRVNGKVPSYGCSNYKVNAGDVVEFLYSCNLGADIGVYSVIDGE